MSETFKIAAAQLAPVFLDRERTVAKSADAVRDAGSRGCSLVAFGETFVPAYPIWTSRSGGAEFGSRLQKELHAEYLDAAVVIERGDLDPLRSAARAAGCWVVVGVAEKPLERGGQTVYASAVTIDSMGEVRSVHRKLMPTFEERLNWGAGDAHGLRVHDFPRPGGPMRLGALNCWENWMPLARSALYAQGESLHVAIWPGGVPLTEDITRFIARESRSYVLSAGVIIRPEDVPDGVPHRERYVDGSEAFFCEGGSCIAGPDGEWIVEPVAGREELVIAEVDPRRVMQERQNFDPSGHYGRPELLRLTVDRRRARAAVFLDDDPAGGSSGSPTDQLSSAGRRASSASASGAGSTSHGT